MKISVVTPSFNQGAFLERTLVSVLDQQGVDLEYIVMDGGSTDGSVDIIKRYAPRLAYWASEPDRGQSDAINRGFERCTGDIVTWLNSDDVLLPGALAAVAQTFAANPSAEAVYGDFIYIDGDDEVLRKRRVFRKFKYETLLFHDYLGQPAVFYRRRVLDKVGLLDESLRYAMDWDFFLRMKRSCDMVHVRQYLAGYRLHEDAKTSQEGGGEYAKCLTTIFQRNKRQVFQNPLLNSIYLYGYKWVSRFLRLYTVLRDNPLDFWKGYKRITGGRYVRGLLWRLKY